MVKNVFADPNKNRDHQKMHWRESVIDYLKCRVIQFKENSENKTETRGHPRYRENSDRGSYGRTHR